MQPSAQFSTGLGLVFVAVLIWGAQLPIAKGIFPFIDGYAMTLIRYAIAVSIFCAVLWRAEGPAAFRYEGRATLAWFAGAVGMGASAMLVFLGLELTRPEIAVIILALQPAMTAIAEWVVHGRRPPRFTLVCLVFAFLGVVIAVTRGGSGLAALLSSKPQELLGDLLVLLGAVAWVMYTMLTQRLTGWSALRLTTLTGIPAMAAIAIAWAVAAAVGASRLPDAAALAGAGWRMVYVSAIGVALAMFLWNGGTRHIGSLNAILLLNLMPVITFGIRALEGADFSWPELAGAVMVMAALVANNLLMRRQFARARAATATATASPGTPVN